MGSGDKANGAATGLVWIMELSDQESNWKAARRRREDFSVLPGNRVLRFLPESSAPQSWEAAFKRMGWEEGLGSWAQLPIQALPFTHCAAGTGSF